MDAVSVIGAGAWGTALANCIAAKGRRVNLWGRDRARMAAMAVSRENSASLPGLLLGRLVEPTDDLRCLQEASLVLVAIPAQNVRQVGRLAMPFVGHSTPVIACSKGIERETGAFVCDVLAEIFTDSPIAVLSGPSFAIDVARGLPTAVTLACSDVALAAELAREMSSSTFRVYSSGDVRGVEIGGAAKNVLAIACGIAVGAGLGASANAALVARGFAELVRLGACFGAKPETLTGLSGLGDLVLTCTSAQSRNFAFGKLLGEGIEPKDLQHHAFLVEGAHTAQILVDLAQRHGVDLPICGGVAAVLAGRKSADHAIKALMARPPRPEVGGERGLLAC